MSEPKTKRSKLWLILLILILAPVIVVASWIGTEVMIKQTGNEEFCSGCHTMKPMAASYAYTKHGGNNSLGIRATCVDCHLPHDSTAGYLVAKAQTGIRDVWAELTGNPMEVDWVAKRANRHHYVFDSGCKKCHQGIADGANPEHPAYFAGGNNPFAGEEQFHCVNCHFYVGHSDKSKWINTAQTQP